MIKRALLFLVIAAGLGAASCEQKYAEPDPMAAGYSYYPLAVGDYRVYNVTNIDYRFNVGDTTRFQLRERVDTVFTDQTNTETYKIIRSIRPNENSSWTDDSVFVVTKQSSMVLLTKDNTKYVKLVFPVKNGAFWLGDAYNSRLEQSYEPNPKVRSDYYKSKEPYTYTNVGDPFTIGDQNYTNTVTVVQGTPTETWIGMDNRKEVYAQEVGMVYRLFTRIIYCNKQESKDCEYAIGFKLQGNERHEILVSHGKM